MTEQGTTIKSAHPAALSRRGPRPPSGTSGGVVPPRECGSAVPPARDSGSSSVASWNAMLVTMHNICTGCDRMLHSLLIDGLR